MAQGSSVQTSSSPGTFTRVSVHGVLHALPEVVLHSWRQRSCCYCLRYSITVAVWHLAGPKHECLLKAGQD